MITRRLVVTLALLALVSNGLVFAKPASSPIAAGGQAFTITSLKYETVGSLTRILVESNSPPLYTVFRPTARLLQVELTGGEGSQLATEYAVKSALVDSILVNKGRNEATRSTKLDISLRDNVSDSSKLAGNTLIIELAPTSNPAVKASDTGDQKAKAATADAQSDKQGIYVYPMPTAAQAKAASAPAQAKAQPALQPTKAASVVNNVRSEFDGNQLRIVVHTDGAAQFKDFVLADPWRIVVDITGVRLAGGNKTANVGVAAIERMRVGQPTPNVVRIVLDAKSKVQYRVERQGTQLVIVIGQGATSGLQPATSAPALPMQSPVTPEVKVAGQRVTNEPAKSPDQSPATTAPNPVSTNATVQVNKPMAEPSKSAAQPIATTKVSPPAKESVSQPVSAESQRRMPEAQRAPQQPSTSQMSTNTGQSNRTEKVRPETAFCDPNFVGGPISFDLRQGVDLRDMLRFVSHQYGVNFIVDKSVSAVPVELRMTDIPWNHAIESVFRANRLGALCEGGGRVIRIASLEAILEETKRAVEIQQAEQDKEPLETRVFRLRYARAFGSLSSAGGSANSTPSGGGGGGFGGGANGQGSGTMMSIMNSRLSKRGKIETDFRTNTLIVTDLPGPLKEIEKIIAQLDRPMPQVEIEARIVIASRNFLRDIGNELAAASLARGGEGAFFGTSPVTLSGNGLTNGGAGGAGGGSGGGSGGSGGTQGLGPNLLGPVANGALRGTANTVLSLTTGLMGSSIIANAISASETKGQIRTIASPRITTEDNQPAEIVNGVQIPVQTVSNNTVTTTFVTAALRLQITPQIVEDTGEVMMRVLAENNTVNAGLANQFNGGTPGINTQAAQTVVRVSDGGTTVMGGINIDLESNSIVRTPGLSRVPLLGEMFKKRSTRRDYDEVLFFITPRIVRNDGAVGPRSLRSSAEPAFTNPNGTQQAAAAPAASGASGVTFQPATPAVAKEKDKSKNKKDANSKGGK